MQHIEIDEYVLDVLMPDLVHHDRSPNAFLVYLVLWTMLYRSGEKRVRVSLQQLAERAGISKSSVQGALRRLRQRGLINVTKASPTAVPEYELARHWLRRRAKARAGGRPL